MLAITAPIVNVNDVAAVLAVTTGFSKVDKVVLHVMPNLVPKLSSTVNSITLLAVTALEFTTRVGLVPVGNATEPDAAVPHPAGDIALAQLVPVLRVFPFNTVNVPCAAVVFPICGGAAKIVFTNAVVDSCVLFVPTVAVGAVGVPVSAGDANGANDVATNAVVANCVLFVPAVAVGAAGTPVNVGDANGANPEMEAPDGIVTVPVNVGDANGAKLVATNAVVAARVLLLPAVCVTKVGDPV